ncbi:MAG: hypothetical protein PHQ01_00390 [Candidatus Pacebacteria bacterium]|nr:hypothetical protein [Candidatus Paceibacterota bacterium]
MKLNDLILEKAIKTLEKNESHFKMGTLEFLVEKKGKHVSQLGEMPTFFTHRGERYVLFQKPDKK